MNKERLLRGIDHLRNGKLGHKVFDFSTFNRFDLYAPGTRRTVGCGTAGCFIGECPIIWPEEWEFNYGYLPVLREGGGGKPSESAMGFFGITGEEFQFLFMPGYKRAPWNDFNLGPLATKEEVAQGMENFINRSPG